jgi:hypothetical protein
MGPNGILSASRYGVWPKHLRKACHEKRSLFIALLGLTSIAEAAEPSKNLKSP